MSSFDESIKVVLAHEGGWVLDPRDLGRETNFGISMKFIESEKVTPQELGVDDLQTPGCLKKMKVETAKAIYRKYFWDRFGYGKILDQKVATKLMDVAVNCGPSHAHKLAQEAANDCGQHLETDGLLGPKSFEGLNACDPVAWMKAMCARQLGYYKAIVVARPINAAFMSNWTKRAAWGL